MTAKELFQKIENIKPWKRGDERAPHKPFLILYALGQWQRGKRKLAYFEHEEALKDLFRDFGPDRKPTMANPFTRLITDGIWDVQANKLIDRRVTYSDKDLRSTRAEGSFTPEVSNLLNNNPNLISQVAEQVLEMHFPESLHESLLLAAGIQMGAETKKLSKSSRDPNFRNQVLEAYERKCAVCNYQIRRDDTLVGIEAAHIKWHQFKGPDVVQNGVALCSLHHKLYDFGLFTITEDFRLKVSTKANGNESFHDWLLRFNDQTINRPQSKNFYPEPEYINWQVKEVFKGGYRE